MAQTGLLRQWKSGTHGAVAGARDNAPSCAGAPMEQDQARASIPNPLLHGSALPPATLAAHRWTVCRTGHEKGRDEVS